MVQSIGARLISGKCPEKKRIRRAARHWILSRRCGQYASAILPVTRGGNARRPRCRGCQYVILPSDLPLADTKATNMPVH